MTYRVSFYRFDSDKNKEEHIATVNVDDYGTGNHLTLMAKAFRQAPERALSSANVVRVKKCE